MGRYPKVKAIMTYDSEAYIDESGKHRLAYGAFAYKRGEKYYTKVIRKPEEFFKFLEDYKNCLVFIHNAKYDLSLFRLTRYKDQIDKIFMDRPIAVFLKNNTWIIDSMNLLPASLKELQKVFLTDQDYQMLGVDKNYKNEVDYEKAKENRKEWNIYINRYGAKLAREDALILYRIMEKFFELIRVGKDKYRRIISLPQLAYLEIKRLLREYLKQNNLPIIIYKRIFDKEERDPQLNAEEALLSYKGGRVEAFKVNSLSVPLTFYDVNSLYPAVMYHFIYPYQFYDTRKRDVIKAYQDQLVGIHLVTWDCGDNPIIPIVTKTTINKRQILTQVSKGKDWITSPELEKLEDECEVTIHKSIYYKAFPIFRPFVQYYYERKESTPKDSPLYTVYKLILNSGYGKFGQNKARRTPVSDIETEIVEKLIGKDKTRIKIGDKYYTLVDEHFVTTRVELKEKIAVAIASFVTAYA
ncbi:MAG: DNA polymerase, partial [Candidatus Micrarchaeaceae archaeon]